MRHTIRLAAILTLIFAIPRPAAADGDTLQSTLNRADIWIHPAPFGFCNGLLNYPKV